MLLCTRDPRVVEAVEVSAAALEVPLLIVRDAAEAATAWEGAALRLVGVDVAVRWPRLPGQAAFLIGTGLAELALESARFGVAVVPLPDESGRLAELLSSVRGADQGNGLVVALSGASGGLGVSTLVAGLAFASAHKGRRAVAVDLAIGGGGLDLLVGAETMEGYRWPDLAKARGELGDVWPSLPCVAGAAFLSLSRDDPSSPPREAVAAVLAALRRTCDVVVVDAAAATWIEADLQVLVVGADVRSIAAAHARREANGRPLSGVVLRSGPGRSIPAPVAARSLGADLLGVIRHSRSLPRMTELGVPPRGRPVRGFARDVARLEGAIHG